MKGETEALAACLAEGGKSFAWLSTTGGPLDEESASESRGCVLLEPIEPGTSGAPVIEKVLFGPGFNDVINVGRDDGLDVPLDLRAVSKVHCQFLLRTFRWSGDDPEKKHEANVHQAIASVEKKRRKKEEQAAFASSSGVAPQPNHLRHNQMLGKALSLVDDDEEDGDPVSDPRIRITISTSALQAFINDTANPMPANVTRSNLLRCENDAAVDDLLRSEEIKTSEGLVLRRILELSPDAQREAVSLAAIYALGNGDDSADQEEAFFLRDVSRNGTLVNGVAAVRPLHWLQDGDVIGVFRAPNDPQVQDCWKVVYIKLDRLRNKEHDAPEVPSKGKSAPVASHETQSGKASQPKTKAPTTGAGKAKAKAKAKMPEVRILAEDVVGDIIDIRYVEPDETFRVKVVRYDVESKYHQVDSTGYSTWDGESFDDTLDLNEFYQAGRLTFIEVDDSEGATAGDKAQTATSLPPKKKARMTNKRSA